MPNCHTLRLLFLVTLAILVTACQSEKADAPLQRYLSRLANTTGVEATQFIKPKQPSPPRSGSLKIKIAGGKLNALDFLSLGGCELQITVSKRNSSLGRMARDSQRLLLELEFLRLAPACIETLSNEDKTSLAEEVQQAWEAKRKWLPALIFNATLAGEEYRYFWQTSKRLGTYPAVGDSSVAQALGAINQLTAQWLSGDYRADNQEFELHLGKIAGGGGGALLSELATQLAWLESANQMLEQRMSRGPLCGESFRHPEADILPNVVRRFFVEGIQPRSAVLNNRQYALYASIEGLETQLLKALPAEYLTWQLSRDQLLRSANTAPRRHVEKLLEIQKPCGA